MDFTPIIDFDKHLLLALNGSHSLWLDNMAHILTTATTWIPLYVALLYMVIKCNDNMRQVFMIICAVGLCVFISGSLNDMFVKPMVERWRPSHDPEIGMLVDTVNGYRSGNYGFFSSHAANTFSIAVFFSLLVRSRLLTISLISWSLVNCWTRMYLGVHFPGDIMCGLLWGGIVASVVYYVLFRIIGGKTRGGVQFISHHYTSTGYGWLEVDVVISVFMFILMYAVVKSCYIC
ncbi:MAG: phosphatase PAP2 family protein [Prevotella sp.]|nr:phosphatase PAP2 family protein [Prevotella sp.]